MQTISECSVLKFSGFADTYNFHLFCTDPPNLVEFRAGIHTAWVMSKIINLLKVWLASP